MKLGFENRKQATWAAVLGVIAIVVILYEVVPLFSGAPVAAVATSTPSAATPGTHPVSRAGSRYTKAHAGENLDPTLQLQLLSASENTKYEGSGRNIFVSQAEAIPTPIDGRNGTTDHAKNAPPPYTPPTQTAPPPINLKFFGFASKPGEPKKIFLSQGEDVFIAGEGEIIDRRYKVVRISPTTVEIQDLVNSGPPQTVQLTQG